MFGPKNSYAGDPRQITARRDGIDKNGRAFKAGDIITWYPRDKTVLSGEAGEKAYREFAASAADEKFLGG
jgi:hypothetical protein